MEALNWIIIGLLICAGGIDLIGPMIISKGYSGYNHLTMTISELGSKNSPVRKKESAFLVISGIIFVFSGVLHPFITVSKTIFSALYWIGIVVYGSGTILAGLFSEDSVGEPETINGKVHGIASGLGFLCLILNPLWAIFISNIESSEYLVLINILFFGGSIITFVLFVISGKSMKETKIEEKKGRLGFLRWCGLYQRLNILILYSSLVFNIVLLFQ